MTNQSCLTRRLSKFVDLSDSEVEFLTMMEKESRAVSEGDVIVKSDGAPIIMVLNSGWAAARVNKPEGEAIVRIFLPGEVVGLAEIGVDNGGFDVTMQTDGVICPMERIAIRQLFIEQPRLAALMTGISGLDQVTLRDRLAGTFLNTAEDRLMWFLLDLRARLAVAGVGSGNRFRVPFTQAEIGSALGVTSIYVSRMLSNLVKDGWIEIERPYYRLLRREEMEQQIAFVDQFACLDTSWFPPPS